MTLPVQFRNGSPQIFKPEVPERRILHGTPDAIRTAARNTDDIYEIAFTLNVSVEFLRESIDWYMARGLWSQETLPDELGEGTSAPDSALD